MAPDNNVGCYLPESNRQSPRILKKKTKKVDVSEVNNKIDFMRSLNLLNNINAKPNKNKDVARPKEQLKESSMVVESNDYNKKSLANNQFGTDRNTNKMNVNECRDCVNDHCNKENLVTSCRNELRRPSKDFAKVVIKIGDEVCSNFSLKKKYINNYDENSNELRQTNANNTATTEIHKPNKKKDPAARKLAKLRKWAFYLTDSISEDHERQKQMKLPETRQRLNSVGSEVGSSSNSSSDNCEDEAVVPSSFTRSLSNLSIAEDEIQEVYYGPSNSKSDTKVDLITIDGDSDDDCVILDENISYLPESETSYNIHVQNCENKKRKLPLIVDSDGSIKRLKIDSENPAQNSSPTNSEGPIIRLSQLPQPLKRLI